MSDTSQSDSWIRDAIAEAEAKYASAYGDSPPDRKDFRSPPKDGSPEAAVARAAPLGAPSAAIARERRRNPPARAASFMVVGAAAMLALFALVDWPALLGPAPTGPNAGPGSGRGAELATAAPAPRIDPLETLASLVPMFEAGEVALPDLAALETLERQLDTIRESAAAALPDDAMALAGHVTRLHGGVVTIPRDGSALIGPAGGAPVLVSFTRARNGLFGGYVDGQYVTLRVGDRLSPVPAALEGCALSLAALQRDDVATFLLRCR